MIRYVITITWPRPATRIERHELDAEDMAHAVRKGLALPRPAGASVAVRPCGYVDYDWAPTVPGDFDDSELLRR